MMILIIYFTAILQTKCNHTKTTVIR